MKGKRRPVYKKGERNALCPHYGECLDEAIAKSWNYWHCLECPYKSSRDPSIDLLSTIEGAISYYELPTGLWEEA
ncbi:MAG: hypothetical protein JRJ78_13785 [Deltaproteobacteria bacterium]|nr:hypothetical protein [Deltaproteobacteria bacterium]